MTDLHYDGSDVDVDAYYAVEGSTLRGLLKLASEMSSGVKMDADRRRDAAQWMQERLIKSLKVDL